MLTFGKSNEALYLWSAQEKEKETPLSRLLIQGKSKKQNLF